MNVRRIRLRDLRTGDIDAVMAIDAASYPRPWGRQLYVDDIGDRKRGRHLVAVQGRTVFGHGGVLYLDGDAHLSTVAVHPDHRGQGTAVTLMRRLVEYSIDAECEAMTLEVRVDNRPALALYRRFGFAPVGVRPGYYDDPDGKVDALVMWLRDLHAVTARLGSMPAEPAPAGRGAA